MAGPFVGVLDEVAIYTNLLSQERITAHWDVLTPVHYASPTGASVWPYFDWATAATNIQDAVDVASPGDTVFVTNGTYNLSSEISVTKAITIESVNGREVTIVDGQNAHRCFNLGNSTCVLNGFTIQNGNASFGGGIDCSDTNSVINDCTLSGNSADRHGGGSYAGTLFNCTLLGNSANEDGGGCAHSTLNNCTLSGNESFRNGGGSFDGTLNNCTLTGNIATNKIDPRYKITTLQTQQD